MKTYQIVKYGFMSCSRVIKRGLTLKQAKAHCEHKNMNKKELGEFVGYEKERILPLTSEQK